MLNKYDFKYILKRVLAFIAIGFITGLMGSCNAKAFTINVNGTKYTNIVKANQSHDFGMFTNNQNYNFNYSTDITCDTDMCGIEFVYSATCTLSTSNNDSNTFSNSFNVNAIMAQMNDNSTYPLGSINGNTISFLVPKNTHMSQLNLSFSGINLNTNFSSSNGVCRVTLNGTSTIYNVDSKSVAEAVNDVNNSINDSSVDTGSGGSGGAFGNMEQSQAQNGTISSLVLMPITLLQSILNGFNGSCSGVNLGTIFDYEFILPCINPQDYIGIIWNIIDTICAGFIAYSIGKRMVVIFNNLTNLRDGGLAEAYD